jgi:hypothetical protein
MNSDDDESPLDDIVAFRHTAEAGVACARAVHG